MMRVLDDVAGLVREAAEWRLLGLLFECPSAQWLGEVGALAAELDDVVLRGAAEEAMTEASEGLYHSTFGPGGPAPPREASYQDTVQLGYLISELEAYYGAFAYQRRCAEPADHVATEAGFVGYLRLKQAYALSAGDEEGATVTGDAAAQFVKEHLATIAEPLAGSLAESGVGYLRDAAVALLRRTGPSVKLPVLQDPLVDDDSVECGI
ncbi:MAG: molecular chaperone TorD family protein [Acidobacteria bacterium]|nr:molecular chaperone TorD family protein [Acidobacteriota bacterium]